jgi:hypothetical protein
MAFGPSAGDLTILGSSGTVSNVINGGGLSLAGFIFPASGWDGTGFILKEGLGPTAGAGMLMYDSSASALTITTPASASTAIMVKLDPKNYHTMKFMHLVASSAQSSAIIVKPVWTRYNPR